MHPAGVRVEPLIDEELSPGAGAIGIQPVVARHLRFRAEIETGVRVDEEEPRPLAVSFGAMAMPFDPDGSRGTAPSSSGVGRVGWP